MIKKMYLFISLLVIFTSFLRFNRQDLLINKFTQGDLVGDHIHYYQLVKVFRNSKSIDLVQAPFNTRLLPSLIASSLPFQENFSLNLVNIIFLILGYILIYKSLIKIKVDQYIAIFTTSLYIVTFPVFYYGAIGYIEPVLIGFYMIGIYFLLQERYLKLSIIIFLGVFVKETIFILVLVSILYVYFSRKKSNILIFSISLSYLLSYIILKSYLYYNTNQSYQWIPRLDFAISNLSRPRTYFTLLISIFPIIISLVLNSILSDAKCTFRNLFLKPNKFIIVFGSGIIFSFTIYIYSIFSAYTDGRFIWLSYPYAIILTGYILNENHKLKATFSNLFSKTKIDI